MNTSSIKKLPIGIQTFAKIRQGNYCYVDKTPLISQLVDQGEFYFLSRPRRFGKSLLIDTIAEAFAGSRELFKGLYLENHWDWETSYPIIRIDFAESILNSRERLDEKLCQQIDDSASLYNLQLERKDPSDRLHEFIHKLYKKTGQQIVVLVDEYDKPILDNITNPEKAAELRDGLRNFYSVLKAQSAYLRFVMLTGVSKFSKVSLFSGLNNLKDITLDARFVTICGYTQTELETIFYEYLDNVDLNQVKTWYNGYNFLAEPVYNPFDVLLYLRNREFKPYWFETGTPTFLLDLIHQQKSPSAALEQIEITDTFMGSFDVDFIEPAPLLFQTGYLTITNAETYPGGMLYTLGYPNHEIRHAFNSALLVRLTQSEVKQDACKISLLRALEQLKQKNYAEKYQNQPTWLIGIEFSKTDRNISRFEWEQVK